MSPSTLSAEVGVTDTLVSSFRTVPLAVEVRIVAPLAPDRFTSNPSSGSTSVSAETSIMISILVSPSAKFTVPLGRLPPKSSPLTGSSPCPRTMKLALAAPDEFPVRVTVKVKPVLPESPSVLSAEAAAIESPESSFRIVPVAPATDRVVPEGLESVTMNPSSVSTSISPETSIVMT